MRNAFSHILFRSLPLMLMGLFYFIRLAAQPPDRFTLKDTLALLQKITDAQDLEGNQPEAAKAIYRDIKAISDKLGWQTGILKYYSNYTAVLNQQSRFDSSLQLNLEGLKLAKAWNRADRIAPALVNIGVSYSYLNDPEASIQYYEEALDVFGKMGDSTRHNIIYENIGQAYAAIRNFEAAKSFYHKAWQLNRSIKDTLSIIYLMNNLAHAYTNTGQFDSALICLQEGTTLNQVVGNGYVRMNYALNRLNIMLQTRRYTEMDIPGLEALQLSRALDDPTGEANACYGLGWQAMMQQRWKAAEQYALQGFAAASRVRNNKELMELYNLRSLIALAQGDMAAFDSLYWRSDAISDSVLNESIQRSTMGLAARYESTRKELRISALEKDGRIKRQWNYLLAISLAAAIIITALGWRNAKHRRNLQQQEMLLQQNRIAELEKEKQLLATQALLKGQEAERSRLAKDLHDGLGSMLSGIKLTLGAMKGNMILPEESARQFAGALNKLDDTIAEMRRVAHSMMPEALLRLGLNQALHDVAEGLSSTQKLRVIFQSIGMEERLPADTEIVLYRIVQELLNNVVKHADATEAIVQLSKQANLVTLTVEDNGRGFDTSVLERSSGAGWRNIQSRVGYLNGSIDFKSAPNQGCSVLIEIPLS